MLSNPEQKAKLVTADLQTLRTSIPRSTTTLLAPGNLPDHGCKPWEVDGTARLSPPGIAGWADRCPVMVTGSEPGPGEEGEGSHPTAGIWSRFSLPCPQHLASSPERKSTVPRISTAVSNRAS